MAEALRLAAKGIATSHPNPRVGCVVVKGGEVVGRGWHRFAGEAHAETIALREAGTKAKGACVYLTLEPCTVVGKTPPCAPELINAKIARAVIAMQDPNPAVDGAGIAALCDADIEVVCGIGEASARKLNRGFCRRMRDGRPWVTLKMAISLDGKTAMAGGESQWITAEAARRDAHRLRATSSAILTGVGTVLRDDPKMTARLIDGHGDKHGDETAAKRQPLRVILDGNLSTPPSAKILQPPGRALILTAAGSVDHVDQGEPNSDVEVVACQSHAGQLDLHQVMRELAVREVNDLMLEAGPRLAGAMLKQGLVDELVIYIAPSLLGNTARGMVDIPGIETLADRQKLIFEDVRMVGGDLRVRAIFDGAP